MSQSFSWKDTFVDAVMCWGWHGRFRRDPEKFVTSVEGCVEESLEHVYTNDQASTIRFTKPSPAHENLRRELFAQLTPNEVRVLDFDLDVVHRSRTVSLLCLAP
jgi:hypothetical protein